MYLKFKLCVPPDCRSHQPDTQHNAIHYTYETPPTLTKDVVIMHNYKSQRTQTGIYSV